MSKPQKAPAAPRGLLVLAALGVAAAVVYAIVGSSPSPPAKTTPPTASGQTAVLDEPPPGASLESLVASGNARMDAGRYPEAIRYYTRALELDGGQVDVWVDRGACRHALGDEKAARDDFRHALSLSPEHPIAMFNMGVAYMTDDAPDSARAWWNRLLVTTPTGVHADRARELLAHLDSLDRAPAR